MSIIYNLCRSIHFVHLNTTFVLSLCSDLTSFSYQILIFERVCWAIYYKSVVCILRAYIFMVLMLRGFEKDRATVNRGCWSAISCVEFDIAWESAAHVTLCHSLPPFTFFHFPLLSFSDFTLLFYFFISMLFPLFLFSFTACPLTIIVYLDYIIWIIG